ncbi:MAG: hypothetical protein HC924_12645 [Synechococcaceae cyanobacterium SM2_3_2]|nr:hypothetical protein [Synechococcaceae cyanobacterium SM2_3_2]
MVIVIVGILSAVAIPIFLNQVRRARTAEAQNALYNVSRASEEFRLDQGVYPFPRTWRVNPADRSAAAQIFTCTTHLECIEGGDSTSDQYLRIYMYDPFQEKAPNYSSGPSVVNTQVKAVLSADSFSGIIWSVVANTEIAGAYKNVSGDALDCRLGLGSANLVGITDGGPNLEGGCNLKVKDPLPAVGTIVVPSR